MGLSPNRLKGVYLENVVFDATDPTTTGRAWEATLGTETLTDEDAGFETRLAVPGGPVLDLCFQRVPKEPSERVRLHLDVADGQLGAVRLESADPAQARAFWQDLTGWDADGDAGLRHQSGLGPRLMFVPEAEAKPAAKNRIHLDLRLEAGDDPDAIAAAITERGGRELHFGWGDLPWRHYADPSGNEFCVLSAYAG